MVPRMPGGVVRRRGQTAVGLTFSPIRLALQVGTVAGRAVLGIDGRAACHECGILRVRRGGLGARAEPHQRPNYNDGQEANASRGGDPPRPECHLVRSDLKYLTSAAAARTRTIKKRSHSRTAPHIIDPPTPSIIRSIMD